MRQCYRPAKVLKTNLNNKRLVTIGTVFLGASIILALPSVMFVKAGNFKYINRGEAAWLSATNNDDNSNFTIQAANATAVVWINGSKWLTLANTTLIGSGHLIEVNSSILNFTGTAYYNFTSPSLRTILIENRTAYNSTSISELLAAMHSSYALVGTGDFDQFNLTGGITSDTFSVTAPGFGNVVNIFSGTGNSTYNINLGAGASVSITASNQTTEGSTTNVYNIIF